jgi:hypothetical protein
MDWNSSSPHGKHVSALLTLVNVPGAHGAQVRSDLALGAKSSCSPGMHAVALAFGRFWEPMQKCAGGQPVHVPLLLLPYVPREQLSPHSVAPGTVLKVPQAQFSHSSVPLPALNFPAVQFVHTPSASAAWPAAHATFARAHALCPLPVALSHTLHKDWPLLSW